MLRLSLLVASVFAILVESSGNSFIFPANSDFNTSNIFGTYPFNTKFILQWTSIWSNVSVTICPAIFFDSITGVKDSSDPQLLPQGEEINTTSLIWTIDFSGKNAGPDFTLAEHGSSYFFAIYDKGPGNGIPFISQFFNITNETATNPSTVSAAPTSTVTSTSSNTASSTSIPTAGLSVSSPPPSSSSVALIGGIVGAIIAILILLGIWFGMQRRKKAAMAAELATRSPPPSWEASNQVQSVNAKSAAWVDVDSNRVPVMHELDSRDVGGSGAYKRVASGPVMVYEM